MTSFNIEEYINSLPSDITVINLKKKGLTYLPDLSRFYQLMILYVNNNLLKQLPKLPSTLKVLDCRNNQITRLPKYPPRINCLFCDNNKITTLPDCIPPSVMALSLYDNPIIDRFGLRGMEVRDTVRKITKLQKFRNTYYTLKFKNRFHKWLWRSRETKIREKYSPANLMKLLEGIEDEEEFHSILDAW